jgi:hypothetical protein
MEGFESEDTTPYSEYIKDPAVERFIKDATETYRRDFVKTPHESLPEAENRLFYLGAHYPKGYDAESRKDPGWDFEQDILDSTPIIDTPVTLSHMPEVEIGKVDYHFKSVNGMQYNLGYVDDNSEQGREAIREIENGNIKGLSVLNNTMWLGKDIKDPKMRRVMVPLHMGLVKEPQKDGCYIHWYKKMTMKDIKNEKAYAPHPHPTIKQYTGYKNPKKTSTPLLINMLPTPYTPPSPQKTNTKHLYIFLGACLLFRIFIYTRTQKKARGVTTYKHLTYYTTEVLKKE